MGQDLFAFWKYDLFPYVSGGRVEEIGNGGLAKIIGYQGFVFKPFHITTYKDGVKRYDDIKIIENEYKEKCKMLKEEYTEKVELALGMRVR